MRTGLHEMKLSRRTLLAALVPATTAPLAWSQAAPLKVVASFSILADLARNVGGDAAEVHALVGPDADAHAFQPRPADAQRLAAADLVLVNGLGFEGWLQRLVAASGYRGPVVVASAGIVPLRGATHAGHGHAHESDVDPHAWQDLARAQRYVQNLQAAFSAARSSQAAGFAARAERYLQRLRELDAATRQGLAAVPAERRRVLSTHDAFGYFAAAYGVQFLAARGRNSSSEPSAADVARLIVQIRRQRATAVFVENISDPRLVQRIAQEAGAVVGGRLYSDALSAPGSEADTFLKLFAHNAQTITAALRGR